MREDPPQIRATQKTGVSCLGPPRVVGNHVAQNPIHPTARSTSFSEAPIQDPAWEVGLA